MTSALDKLTLDVTQSIDIAASIEQVYQDLVHRLSDENATPDNQPMPTVLRQFPELSRFAVMKHLDVLRDVSLEITRRDGRRRLNSLNAVPIRRISERWINNYEAFLGQQTAARQRSG